MLDHLPPLLFAHLAQPLEIDLALGTNEEKDLHNHHDHGQANQDSLNDKLRRLVRHLVFSKGNGPKKGPYRFVRPFRGARRALRLAHRQLH